MAWNCGLCSFTALMFGILISHFNTNHVNEDSYTIRCGVRGCDSQYTKVNSFVRHVYLRHPVYLHCTEPSEMGSEPAFIPKDNDFDLDYHGHAFDDEEHDTDDEEDVSFPHDMATVDDPVIEVEDTVGVEGSQIRKFLFKIKEENRLTQKCLQQIARATKQLFEGSIGRIKRKIEDCLSSAGVESGDVLGFEDSFQDDFVDYSDIMASDMETFHKTEDCNVPFVEPKKIVLGKRRILRKRGNKKRVVMVDDTFYYIPLLKSLELQLSSPRVAAMVLKGPLPSKNPNILSDFCDGTFCQNHALFGNDKNALKILLYYDDVNLCNPLTNKIHKITLMYYQLANIEMEYRSKLSSIHLLGVSKTCNIKRYGINKVFEPLVKDLKLLGSNSGYSFHVFDGELVLRGGILAVLADTPASNVGAGFKESVGGARKKCRHCMATYDTFQQFFSEDDFTLRNLEDHRQHLQLLENAPSNFLREFYSKTYGINERSELDSAPYFDVCEQFPQDIMHVFLEGILAYEIKYLLRYYINEEHSFTIAELNNKIEHFSYGYSQVKDKPCPIKQSDLERQSSTNLGQGAANMWLLAQVLPFILETFVDTETEHWSCFSSLLQLLGMVFSANISLESVLYLKTAIKEHLTRFKRVYPDAPIIPKQHFLVHLPSQIFKFGPLIRSWCMRFEGKHSYFKDLAKKIKNFKNIPLSLAQKNQKITCAEHIAVDGRAECSPLFGNEILFGKYKRLGGTELESARRCISRFHTILPTDVVMCNSITLNGTRYVPGNNNFLHIGYNDNGLPEFGILLKIWFISNANVFFVTKVVVYSSLWANKNA